MIAATLLYPFYFTCPKLAEGSFILPSLVQQKHHEKNQSNTKEDRNSQYRVTHAASDGLDDAKAEGSGHRSQFFSHIIKAEE